MKKFQKLSIKEMELIIGGGTCTAYGIMWERSATGAIKYGVVASRTVIKSVEFSTGTTSYTIAYNDACDAGEKSTGYDSWTVDVIDTSGCQSPDYY